MQLSLLVGPLIDPDHTKNKSFNDNCSKINSNISYGVSGKELVAEKKLEMEVKIETEDLQNSE